MGQEAVCRARFEGRESEGKAKLESEDLRFAGDFRFAIPFREMRAVRAEGGWLAVESARGTAELELGPAAEKWAHKILHPKSRAEKLGVKPGLRVAFAGIAGADEAELRREIEEQGGTIAGDEGGALDLLLVGADRRDDLRGLESRRAALARDGALWIVYPKGQERIREGEVLAAGKAAGLVDVKVIAFSPTHTALKFVVPLSAR